MQSLQTQTLLGTSSSHVASDTPPPPRFVQFMACYTTALVVTGIVMPMFATTVTAGLYFLPSLPPFSQNIPNWYCILFGFFLNCILWLFLALCISQFTTARTANARFYGRLISRLRRLQTRLQLLPPENAVSPNPTLPFAQKTHSLLALEEARTYVQIADETLNHSGAGIRWISSTGYLNVWETLHRAEEALIEVEPSCMVIRTALRDQMHIESMQIPTKQALLQKLALAIKPLSTSSVIYFEEYLPGKDLEPYLRLLQKMTQNLQPVQEADPTAEHTSQDAKNDQKMICESQTAIEGRLALREIRRAINDFKDLSWDKVLQLRNQLIRALALTELGTYLLLCLAILANAPRPTIVAGIAFYLIGAIAGLFGRFYAESGRGILTDDYGLTTARLLATPSFSGLAGIAGAFVTVVLSILSGHQIATATPTLADIFHLEPLNLFVAAVFGLTPNLVMQSLQRQAEVYQPENTQKQGQPVDPAAMGK